MSKVVVVAEDDNDIRGLVLLVLEEAGFTVVSTAGLDTLPDVRSQQPDVLLLDYQMPGLDGISIAKEIRADPEMAEVPIIAMTAAGSVARVCQLMDANGCLGKPFDIDHLVSIVEKAVHTAH